MHKKSETQSNSGERQSGIPYLLVSWLENVDAKYIYNKYLFLFDTDANNLNIKANTSLKELNTWSEINKLSLNIEKTCYVILVISKICIKLVLNQWHQFTILLLLLFLLCSEKNQLWNFHEFLEIIKI